MSGPRYVPLVLLALLGCAGAEAPAPAPTQLLRAPEFPPVPALPDWSADPPSAAKMKLGAALFFDQRLSGHGRTSCDPCHNHLTNFQDNLSGAVPDRSYPNDQPVLPRNTPSLFNIVYAPILRWDGELKDLADAMVFPFSEPNMNLGLDVPSAQHGLKQRLTTDFPGYVSEFQSAFAADIRSLPPEQVWRLAGRALAAFIRQAVSRDAAFDRWNAGDDSAMSPDAVRGLALFRGSGRCVACHSGPFFTDFSFHNLSTSPPRPDGTRADEGRALISKQETDRGAFLTPTLRGAYDTWPYFHDGSVLSLRGVLRHLSSAAVTLDPNHDRLFDENLVLSNSDIDDLIEFLKALRGQPVSDISPPTTFP